ncbi:MAG: 30S ribosomal protein S6 [Anaerolineaceae bacterium]|nr:30S ribosomal protein S6 [Anaerolineaceae bacterium]
MRNYEFVFIVHPDLDENAFNEICERIKGWINDLGGTVVSEDKWGKRRMAYPIRKQREGQYMLYNIQLDPEKVTELEHNMQLVESIMRYLTIKVEEDQPTLETE